MTVNTKKESIIGLCVSLIVAIIVILLFVLSPKEPEVKDVDRKELAILDHRLSESLNDPDALTFGYISKNSEYFTLNTVAYDLSALSNISYKHEFRSCTSLLTELNQPYFRFSREGSQLIVSSVWSKNEISKDDSLKLVSVCSEGFNKFIKKYEQERADNTKSWEGASEELETVKTEGVASK